MVLPENSIRPVTSRQRVCNGPCAICGTGNLQYLANSSVLDVRDGRSDGRAGDRAVRWRVEAGKRVGRFSSQGQCSLQVIVLEGTGHAVDLDSAHVNRLRDVSPGRSDARDFLDDRASLRQRQREELRGGLQQIE